MRSFVGVAAMATGAVSLDLEVHVESSLKFDEAAAKNRPVSKVITLLKDMLKQLEKEAEEDEEIYDQLACWCETNDKEKTKSIADAEGHIEDLTTKIEELTAGSSPSTPRSRIWKRRSHPTRTHLTKPLQSGKRSWLNLMRRRKTCSSPFRLSSLLSLC